MDSILEKGSGLQRTWGGMKIQSEKFAQQREHPGFGGDNQNPIFSQILEIGSETVAKFRVKP